jgi:hypothetical protein
MSGMLVLGTVSPARRSVADAAANARARRREPFSRGGEVTLGDGFVARRAPAGSGGLATTSPPPPIR